MKTYGEEEGDPFSFQSLINVLPSRSSLTSEVGVINCHIGLRKRRERERERRTINVDDLVHAGHVDANAATRCLVEAGQELGPTQNDNDHTPQRNVLRDWSPRCRVREAFCTCERC
mgnify:CR=1 FL=1